MINLVRITKKIPKITIFKAQLQQCYRFSSLNQGEMSQFNKLQGWWSPNGPMSILYEYNYHSITFLKRNLDLSNKDDSLNLPFSGLKILDVGCGAGFLSESMTRLGAKVTALDPNQTSYLQAKTHSQKDQTLQNLTYHNITLEQFLEKNAQQKESFDIVTSMEVVQHVNNPQNFIKNLAQPLKQNGLMMLSTIARSPFTWISHILAAEYLFRIVPPGTHNHSKFINPSELQSMMKQGQVEEIDRLELQVNFKGEFLKTVGGSNYLTIGKKVKNIRQQPN